MKAYNLADLERKLTADGWQVDAEGYVHEQGIPGQVQSGGYKVILTGPSGDSFAGDGATRSDALREAANNAKVIDADQPPLI